MGPDHLLSRQVFRWQETLYVTFSLFSLLLAFGKISVHLGFVFLPMLFFLLGGISYWIRPRNALYVFFFLLPCINAIPDLFYQDYPFNYIAVSLFYLSGMVCASLIKREKLQYRYPWSVSYLVLLGLFFVSLVFVFLRWSNFGFSPMAFFRDTPVSPGGSRISFASIFPVITFFLFAMSPFTFFLIKKNRLPFSRLFRSLLLGFGVSLVIALFQKFINPDFMAQPWWGEKLNQYNGGFSDFNGFGLFSGLLFLYLVLFLLNGSDKKALFGEHLLEFIFLPVTLMGIVLSGSRTALAFVLVAIVVFLFSKKVSSLFKMVFLSVLIGLVLFFGGALKQRIIRSIHQIGQLSRSQHFWESLDHITNRRLHMIEQSMGMITKFPVAGVGCGNFLPFLKYRNYRKKFLSDLPLNQYLLIWDEIGVFGLFMFVLVLLLLMRPRGDLIFYILLWVLVVMLFVNTYLWLQEAILLFWMVAAYNDRKQEIPKVLSKRHTRYFVVSMFVVFLGMNVIQFAHLHPKNLSIEKRQSYDYGFWYPERGERGHYKWSRHRAGLFLPESGRYLVRLFCGAPLGNLQNKRQQVAVFWKGRLYRKVVFLENRMERLVLDIEEGGFLEFRVNPVFNLKSMGLGSESRNLGVQVYRPFILSGEKNETY